MSKILGSFGCQCNYAASFGEKGKLAMPPGRGFAILTCMDARLDPAKYAGLAEGDAHVIRNAGGRASDDAIRSLVISYKLLGTREFFVIHHTNCGMEFFTNEVMRGLLECSLETAELTPRGFAMSAEVLVHGRASTSTGSPSRTRSKLSSTMSRASATTPSCPNPSPSTATSTTCTLANFSKSRAPAPLNASE